MSKSPQADDLPPSAAILSSRSSAAFSVGAGGKTASQATLASMASRSSGRRRAMALFSYRHTNILSLPLMNDQEPYFEGSMGRRAAALLFARCGDVSRPDRSTMGILFIPIELCGRRQRSDMGRRPVVVPTTRSTFAFFVRGHGDLPSTTKGGRRHGATHQSRAVLVHASGRPRQRPRRHRSQRRRCRFCCAPQTSTRRASR